MLKQNQVGRQDKRAESYKFRYNFRAYNALEKLVRQIEKNNVLAVYSAKIEYRKSKYILIVDTVWANSSSIAYTYIWERGKLTITTKSEVIEEKAYNL